VAHYFGRTVIAETVLGFALDCVVDEIGSLLGPSEGYFAFFYEGLFGEDFVSDLLPSLTQVRSKSIHAFKYDDADCIVIDGDSMIASTHDFGCCINIWIPIYPGVPEVSARFSGFHILATPRSVSLRYPFLSNTRFSGLTSRCRMPLLWRNYRAMMIQAVKNSILGILYWYIIN
jgi:hypothetical protein